MNFEETLAYMYARLPMYQRLGASAYKKDLTNTLALCEALEHPEQKFKSIHIAGTNGKGSSSHMLASVFQAHGYKTGLYTSPHLVDFRERIRINGHMMPKEDVVAFIETIQTEIDRIQPSFFELTVAMAFDYFARNQVDIAIIETGLGGRLDSTNVISPELSLITNIGWDHMDMLGNTLGLIAAEKAGIIKENTPVVIGARHRETTPVFVEVAAAKKAPLYFAEDWQGNPEAWHCDLKGNYQKANIRGVLNALDVLKDSWKLREELIREGLQHVTERTGLRGRWELLGTQPKIIADVAHNKDGLFMVMDQLAKEDARKRLMVFGVVKEKELSGIIPLLPKDALYFICEPSVPRKLPAEELYEAMQEAGFDVLLCGDVATALKQARNHAQAEDLIFIGGSTFVVADALLSFQAEQEENN